MISYHYVVVVPRHARIIFTDKREAIRTANRSARMFMPTRGSRGPQVAVWVDNSELLYQVHCKRLPNGRVVLVVEEL